MVVTEEDIKHVAKLAKLEIPEDELGKFTEQMDKIIAMVEQLSELDTEDVPVTTHGMATSSVMREDKAVPGTDRDKLFENVKRHENGLVKVPAMMDNSEGDA